VSDQEFRELARRAAAATDVADQVRMLRERQRIGELSPMMVELAARCGHPAARIVTDRDDVEQDCCADFGAGCKLLVSGYPAAACDYRLGDWLWSLRSLSPHVYLIANIAAADVVYDVKDDQAIETGSATAHLALRGADRVITAAKRYLRAATSQNGLYEAMAEWSAAASCAQAWWPIPGYSLDVFTTALHCAEIVRPNSAIRVPIERALLRWALEGKTWGETT